MAGIDYTIPGQFKGVQVESPENAMMRAMQLRGLQESSQLNALRAQEYQQKQQEAQEMTRQRNELAKIHADPKVKIGSPEYLSIVAEKAPLHYEGVATRTQQRGELEEKIEGRKYQNFERKFNLFKSITPTIKNIDDVSKFIAASYADPDLSPILSQIRPYEDALNANLDAFNEDPENWRLQAGGVTPEKIAEIARTKAKEAREAEKPMVVAPGGQLVSPEGKVLFASPDREKESDLARLQRERAAIAEVSMVDPRLPQYDAAITKLTALPAAAREPESDLARLQRERAGIAAANSTDPRLLQYDAAITKLTALPAAAREPESDLARLQRERAVIAAANSTDPRLLQYDAAIAKVTATNAPLSDLARKQNELAMLEEELKADPNNKGLQQRIKEYKDDIRKDTQFRPTTNVNVAPAVTPVTIQDPNDPTKAIIVDGRTGKYIGTSIKEGPATDLTATERRAREAKRPQATAAIKIYENKSEILAKDLEKLASHPGLSGISGVIFGRTPSGTKDSMAAQALYDSIVARGGFKELSDMRAASPTGGALGNISNQEGQYLRDAFAPISRTQDTSTLQEALSNAARQVRESKARVREAYDMTYEYRGGGEAAPSGARTGPSAMTPADEQALNWANSNPKDPRSAKIKARLGVK